MRPWLIHSIAYEILLLALRAAKIRAEFLLFTSYHLVRETDWEAIPQNTRWMKYSLQKKEQTVRPEEESFMLTPQLHGQDSIIISTFQMRNLWLMYVVSNRDRIQTRQYGSRVHTLNHRARMSYKWINENSFPKLTIPQPSNFNSNNLESTVKRFIVS